MSRRRVVVTGVGLVTPLAPTAAGTWARLVAGETAVRALTVDDMPPEHAAALPHLPCRIGAPVDTAGFAASPHAPAWLAAPPPGATRAAAFASAAAAEAVAAARLDVASIPPGRLAIAIGVGMPAVRDAAAVGAALAAGVPPPPFAPARLLATGPATLVATTLGLATAAGPLDAPATACAAGASAVADGAAAVARGDADVAVVGGAEACVDAVTIAGFSRMRALTTAFNDAPSHASRPFDASRSGFVVGEGAGVLVLEAEDAARARGAPVLATLLGAGLSCDAHHAAQPPVDGAGAAAAMRAALAAAGVGTAGVAHVSAHATSTPAGDAAEAAALAAVFGGGGGASPSPSSPPAVSAVKSAVGHLLGAAGAVEAGLAVLALVERVAPPTAALTAPGVPVRGFTLVGRDPVRLPSAGAAVSNSFGFGGGNVSLVFGRAG